MLNIFLSTFLEGCLLNFEVIYLHIFGKFTFNDTVFGMWNVIMTIDISLATVFWKISSVLWENLKWEEKETLNSLLNCFKRAFSTGSLNNSNCKLKRKFLTSQFPSKSSPQLNWKIHKQTKLFSKINAQFVFISIS